MAWGNYPLLRFLPGFLLGCCADFLDWNVHYTVLFGCCCCLHLSAVRIPFSLRWLLGVNQLLLGFLLGVWVIQHHEAKLVYQASPVEGKRKVQFQAKVSQKFGLGSSGIVTLGNNLAVSVYQKKGLPNVGESDWFCGALYPLKRSPWSGSFDQFLWNQGVRHRFYSSGSDLGASDEVHYRWAFGLFQAMVKGQKMYAPMELKNIFYKSGLAHLFAVSGFHVGFVYLLLHFVLDRWKISKWILNAIYLLGVWGFVFWVGCPVSGLRAGIMLSFVILGKLFLREQDGFQAILVSIAFLVFLSPQLVHNLGFWMSHIAVAFIIASQPLIQQLSAKGRLGKWLWTPLFVGVGVQLSLLPFLLGFEQGLHAGNIPLQLVMNLLFPVLFIAGLFMLLFDPNAEWTSFWEYLDLGVQQLYKAMDFFSTCFVGESWSYQLSGVGWCAFYAALLFLFLLFYKRKMWCIKGFAYALVVLIMTINFPITIRAKHRIDQIRKKDRGVLIYLDESLPCNLEVDDKKSKPGAYTVYVIPENWDLVTKNN